MAQDNDALSELDRLTALPDDLLIVLGDYRPQRELLQMRLVSRRAGQVLLEPCVWRGQDVTADGDALRFATRAGSLNLSGVPRNAPTPPRGLLSSTRCAVKTLRCDLSEGNALAAAGALRRQVKLGELREVEIDCRGPEGGDPAPFRALMEQLLTTEGLGRLSLHVWRERDLLPEVVWVGSASLKRLEFVTDERASSFRYAVLRHLVRCHAPTLQVLHVFSARTAAGEAPPLLDADWLLGNEDLRKGLCGLGCDAELRGMQDLLHFQKLESLFLGLRGSARVVGESGVARYLRDAPRLKRLTLRPSDSNNRTLALELAGHVASSPAAARTLEVLALELRIRDDASLRTLLQALPRFGGLRELRVGATFAAALSLMRCLSATRPRGSSSLTLVVTEEVDDDVAGRPWEDSVDLLSRDGDCCWPGRLHQHRRELEGFFRANPALHLTLSGLFLFPCRRSDRCCPEGGDFDLQDVKSISSVFYGHADSHSCDLPHTTDHSTSYHRIAYFFSYFQ